MPTFCRHNRLVQNCPICSREQAVALRPVVSSSAPKAGASRSADGAGRGSNGAGPAATKPRSGAIKVRQLVRGVDDGYTSRLVPGVRASSDAERLAEELAFAARRLIVLETDPPGLFAVVAGAADDVEERTWLAFQIAYIGPLEDGGDPFREIDQVRTSWSSGDLPALDGVSLGPRTAHEAERGNATLDAYRAWAGRAGSQAAAFGGEASWTPERRFARVFERLTLPGMQRDARYELLVSLGRLSVYELRGAALQFGGENETTVAAKRALGIGDPMLLERRAADLAQACGVPLEALDLALHNWGTGARAGVGVSPELETDSAVVDQARRVLGLA